MVCFAMRGDSVGCFGLKVFFPYVINLRASDEGNRAPARGAEITWERSRENRRGKALQTLNAGKPSK